MISKIGYMFNLNAVFSRHLGLAAGEFTVLCDVADDSIHYNLRKTHNSSINSFPRLASDGKLAT